MKAEREPERRREKLLEAEKAKKKLEIGCLWRKQGTDRDDRNGRK